MNVYIGKERLPSAYQEVEYIGSSGTQYIDTLLNANQNTIVEAKWSLTQYNSAINYDKMYGSFGANDDNVFFMQSNRPANNRFRITNYSNHDENRVYIDSSANLVIGQIYETKHTNTEFYVDGTLQGTCAATTYTSGYSVTIFGLNMGSNTVGQKAYMKLYYFRMYNGNTLVRDFVPCYRKSDSVIGLYDLVNNQFYTNSGTGTFTKGSDVTMAELKNAYIGEYKGWTPGSNTLVYYEFNGNANDLSGNGNNGTASNITWDSGGDGGCASFNGSNSYINIPALSITDSFTISCWIKTTQSSVGEIIQMANSSFTQSFELRVSSGKINLGLWNSGYSEQGGNSSLSINTGQWVNVIVTKSGNNYNLYINSVNDGVFTSSLGMGFSNNRIGLHTNGSASPYNGLIDNFIIENKARTADEISSYYNQTKSNYGL